MKQIDSLVSRCIKKGYITREQAPWLRYGMEKRIITFFISVPMIFVTKHLAGARNLSPNTIKSYRDTFCLLLLFMKEVACSAVATVACNDTVGIHAANGQACLA